MARSTWGNERCPGTCSCSVQELILDKSSNSVLIQYWASLNFIPSVTFWLRNLVTDYPARLETTLKKKEGRKRQCITQDCCNFYAQSRVSVRWTSLFPAIIREQMTSFRFHGWLEVCRFYTRHFCTYVQHCFMNVRGTIEKIVYSRSQLRI